MTSEDEMIEWIKTKSNDRIEVYLKNNPAKADELTEHGISYLMFAIYCRNKPAIELFRKNKSAINIYEASSLGELDALNVLLEHNLRAVNSYSADGFTPLGLACFFGNFDAARYLISNGADVNMPSNNSFKVAPIHSACAISNYELARLLLSKEANPNVKQQSGITPLHEAAHNGQTKLAELLVMYGADIKAKMDNGQTSVSMAEEAGFDETARALRALGGI